MSASKCNDLYWFLRIVSDKLLKAKVVEVKVRILPKTTPSDTSRILRMLVVAAEGEEVVITLKVIDFIIISVVDADVPRKVDEALKVKPKSSTLFRFIGNLVQSGKPSVRFIVSPDPGPLGDPEGFWFS